MLIIHLQSFVAQVNYILLPCFTNHYYAEILSYATLQVLSLKLIEFFSHVSILGVIFFDETEFQPIWILLVTVQDVYQRVCLTIRVYKVNDWPFHV